MRKDPKLQLEIIRRLEAEDFPERFGQHIEHIPYGPSEVLTPDWTDHEAYQIQLMLEDKLLGIEEEVGDGYGFDGDKVVLKKTTYIRPVSKAHDLVDAQKWQRKFVVDPFFALAGVLVSNVGTIIVSVASAVITVVVMDYYGLR